MRDISKRFPGVLALDNVSLSIERGEVHALLGENGAGKSTLMKILSGAYKKDAGEIIFDGQPSRSTRRDRRRSLASASSIRSSILFRS